MRVRARESGSAFQREALLPRPSLLWRYAPDFLNSREDAIVLWSAAILGFVLYKDVGGIGRSMVGVLRALLQPKLLLLFGSAPSRTRSRSSTSHASLICGMPRP